MSYVLCTVMEWPDAPEYARRLRRRRIEKKMPQIVLADRVGVSRVSVGFWERGEKTPTDFNLECWEEALKQDTY